MTMTRKKATLLLFALGFLSSAVACSGGGGAAPVLSSGGSSLAAGFAAAQPPGPNKTTMGQGASSGDLVTVSVNVTDTNGIYGAAFDVTFDPARAQYVSWSRGALLETGGHTPTYQVDSSQAGTVVVAATRNGSVAAVNAVGTKNLINLTFRVTLAGDTPLTFGSPELFDGQVPPQAISGVSWFAGSLQAN
jgi:hypothetical protein